MSSLRFVNNFAGQTLFFVLLLPFFYYSSSLFWQLAYPEGYSPSVMKVAEGEKRKEKSQPRAWSWFLDTTPAPVVEQAKQSELNAKLVGVITKGEGKGIAMIQVKSDPTKLFRVGDEVVQAVFLDSVHSDHVTLRRDDQFEVLALKKMGGAGAEAPEPAPVAAKKVKKEAKKKPEKKPVRADSADEYKKMIREKPIRLIEMVQFKHYEDEEHGSGFELSPRDEEHKILFDSLGIESGDVLLSANDAKSDKLAMSPKTWKSLLRAKQIKLKLLRGGVVQEVVIE